MCRVEIDGERESDEKDLQATAKSDAGPPIILLILSELGEMEILYFTLVFSD